MRSSSRCCSCLIKARPGHRRACGVRKLTKLLDVVPVPAATVDAWTHPPFSGHYDGKFIWGRGASDCKNQLIAVMETLELFLDAGYKPKRTIIVSLGFDEEISGREGAGHLAPYLHDRYGDNGVAAIVDEGAGFSAAWYVIICGTGWNDADMIAGARHSLYQA